MTNSSKLKNPERPPKDFNLFNKGLRVPNREIKKVVLIRYVIEESENIKYWEEENKKHPDEEDIFKRPRMTSEFSAVENWIHSNMF